MAGRKPKYSEQELIDALLKVAKRLPEKKMTPTLLGKETKYPRSAWLSPAYPNVQKALERLNKVKGTEATIEKAKAISGNLAAAIIKANGDDKNLLKAANEYAATMEQIRLLLEKEIEKTKLLEQQCEELKVKLAEQKEQTDFYRRQRDSAYVASADIVQAHKQGINKEISNKLQRGKTEVLDASDEAFDKAFAEFMEDVGDD